MNFISLIQNQRENKLEYIPIHIVPFPSNPGLHTQIWEPSELMQLALEWQPPFVVLHSFTSEIYNTWYLI